MRLLLLFLIPLLLFFISCQYFGGKKVNGNGQPGSEEFYISGFDGVKIGGPFDVYITQGNGYSVRLEADKNLIDYIQVEKDGNVLEINNRRGYNLRPKTDIKVFITAPQFNELSVAGSGSIRSQNKITGTKELNLNIGGSGDLVIEVNAPAIRSSIGGSGSVSLRGSTRAMSAHIGGSGEVHAFDLLSETAQINIAGSGDAEVFASQNLEVSIAGSGDVAYKGTPSINKRIAGSGAVRKIN